MKKFYYLFFAVALSATIVSAQCEADYDFGELTWGIYPDATLEQSFLPAVVDNEYFDVMHILVPSTAQDFAPTMPPFALDSMILTGVTFTNVETEMDFSPEEIGLEYVCNNNGDLPNPCALLGSQQYCMAIQGVPTITGFYQINLEVDGWFSSNGQSLSQPWTFSNFLLNIQCDIIENIETTAGNSANSEDGSVDVTVVDGLLETSFIWHNSFGDVIATTEDLIAEPGVYSLYMTGDGCTSLFEDIVIEDASVDCLLDATYEITNTDEGQMQGVIDLTVTGAIGDANCVWTNEDGIVISTNEDLENADVGVYSISILDDAGCVFELFNLPITLGIDDMNTAFVWDMAPNPATDVFTITSEDLGVKDITIRDVQGKTLYHTTFSNKEDVDVAQWGRGYYFVTVSTANSQSTRRLVITK